jgi:PAS domain S-box-containing protein
MDEQMITSTISREILPLTKTSVLVVDDRPDGLLALEAVLTTEQYDLVKASSGREALQLALYQDFAVILLDVQMPEMDGFETAKLLRENPRTQNTPIIFVTAINKELRHINQGYESGAVDYIFKPLDPFILKSKVDIFVDLYNKNVQIRRQSALLRRIEIQEKERQLQELRQESRKQYIDLADAIPHMVITIQNDGKLEHCNQYWYEYTGLDIDDKSMPWEMVVYPQDVKKLLVLWIRRKRNLDNFQMEARIRQKDGVYKWHLVRFVSEMREDEIIGWIITATDIDNIKKAEKKFRLLSKELDRSNKELEQFAFVASHDLQEPLKIISSYLDLISFKYKEKLDEKALSFIKAAQEGSHRSQRLIRDLLEFARVGIKQKTFSEVDFNQVFNQAKNNLLITIKDKEAEIICDSLPTLLADQMQMVQLFQNVLANAMKYCDNKPKIIIEAKESDEEWIFSIKDNGIGIDKQYYDKIFIIFQRLHLMKEYEGTGMGLAICKKIIERHHGRIWVDSTPGEGSIFHFSLPERPYLL